MATLNISPSIISFIPNHSYRSPNPFHCHPTFFPSKPFPRLRISRKAELLPCRCDASSGVNPDFSKESSVNIQLPRRSLLVQFTCNACGERTKRLVNRLAYERGTVFVQCSGCLQHHKLVDNLGLVVEYDFRNDINEDPMHA